MAADIAAVVGLGNPGEKYARTRHNAGFWVVDRMAGSGYWKLQTRLHGAHQQIDVPGGRLHLLKPDTFMNRSGLSVRGLMDFYKLAPQQLIVVHDDLDLPAGTVRLKRGGGAGGHNGLKDTIRCIGPDFARMRVGIGHPGDREQVLGYVLAGAGRDEQLRLDEAVEAGATALRNIISEGWDRTVQALHSKGD